MQHFLLPSKDKDNRWQTLLPEELGQNLELHLCKMFKLLLDGNRQGALPSFSLHGAAETQQGKPTQVVCKHQSKSSCIPLVTETSSTGQDLLRAAI